MCVGINPILFRLPFKYIWYHVSTTQMLVFTVVLVRNRFRIQNTES
jgi:bacteriorhodopsin